MTNKALKNHLDAIVDAHNYAQRSAAADELYVKLAQPEENPFASAPIDEPPAETAEENHTDTPEDK